MTTALVTKDLAHATARFQVKATAAAKLQFSGLLATWDLDYGGDKIRKGAFKRTLADWRTLGYKIPLIDQHSYNSVRRVVGKLIDAEETDEGLETDWQVLDSPEGHEYYARVKQDMIDGLSIGYEPLEEGAITESERRSGVQRALTEIALKEGSLVIWGMNPYALIDTTSVKSLAGSLASLKRETLSDDDRKSIRHIASLCGALLRPLASPADDTTAAEREETSTAETASPGDPADTQKAATLTDEETDALRRDLLAFQIRQTITGGTHS